MEAPPRGLPKGRGPEGTEKGASLGSQGAF